LALPKALQKLKINYANYFFDDRKKVMPIISAGVLRYIIMEEKYD